MILLLFVQYWVAGEGLLALFRFQPAWMTRLARVGLAYLVGVCGVTLLQILLLWAGVRLSGSTLLWLGAPFWVLAATVAILHRRFPIRRAPFHPRFGRFFLFLSLLYLAGAVTHWFPGWDGVGFWSFKGKILFTHGTVDHPDFTDPDRLHVNRNYPLLVPLLNASVFWAVGEPSDTWVRVAMTLLFLAFVPLYWDLLLARVRDGPLIWISVGTLCLTPFVLFGANGGAATSYGDVPLSCFMFLSLLFLAEGHGPLSAFFLLAGVHTKGEGTAFLATYLFAGSLLVLGAGRPRRILTVLAAVGVAGVGFIPWYLITKRMPLWSAPNFLEWVRLRDWGEGLPLAAEYLGRWGLQAIDISVWGGAWVVLFLFFYAGGIRRWRRPVGAFMAAVFCQIIGYALLMASWPENKDVLIASTLPRLTWHVFPLALYALSLHAGTRFDALFRVQRRAFDA